MAYCDRRVLSIQSHVVSGYVGNKAATFPMQVAATISEFHVGSNCNESGSVLGYEVECINSVQLSNHTQYQYFQGQVLNADELRTVFEGLVKNDIHQYSHLLTGYCGAESFLQEIARVIETLRAKNPNIIVVCDPVLGDHGRFYVPKELMEVYRDQILKYADIITPNQFEAELLSGMKITNEQEALAAMQKLHDKGVKTVVLSSYETPGSDRLTTLATSVKDGKRTGCKVEFSKLSFNFTGTGDLFSALLLVWTHKHPDNLLLACEKTLSTMQAVLQRTMDTAQALAGDGNKPNVAQGELRLIDGKKDIEEPRITVKGSPLTF